MPSILAWRRRVILSWLSGSYEMLPVTSAFSIPPIRCSRPGVPGIAHGRASVSGSRRYGWNTGAPSAVTSFGSVANSTLRSGSSAVLGSRHGSDPFARYPSDRTMTGVR